MPSKKEASSIAKKLHETLWMRRLAAIMICLFVPGLIVGVGAATFGLLTSVFMKIFPMASGMVSPALFMGVLGAACCALAWMIVYSAPYVKRIKDLWSKKATAKKDAKEKKKGRFEKVFAIVGQVWGVLNAICNGVVSATSMAYGLTHVFNLLNLTPHFLSQLPFVIGMVGLGFLGGFVCSVYITRANTVHAFSKFGRFFDQRKAELKAIVDELNQFKKEKFRGHKLQRAWHRMRAFFKTRLGRLIYAIGFGLPVAASSAIFFFFSAKYFRLGMGSGGMSGLLHHPTFLTQLTPGFDLGFAIVVTSIGMISSFCLYASSIYEKTGREQAQKSKPSVQQFFKNNSFFLVMVPTAVAVTSLGYQLSNLSGALFWPMFFPLFALILMACFVSRRALFSNGYNSWSNVLKKQDPKKAKAFTKDDWKALQAHILSQSQEDAPEPSSGASVV